MKITRQQILSAINKADLSRSSFSCDHCWLDHLGIILNCDEVDHPCSYIKELLNKQYHTNYKITPGVCTVSTFPTTEILSKLTRAVKI